MPKTRPPESQRAKTEMAGEKETMKTIKFTTIGKSLLDLRKKYGIGERGFYDNSWWLEESFAKEKSEAGTYEVNLEGKFANITWDEQEKAIPKGWKRAHPALIAEIILRHYKETGKRLLGGWYHWSDTLDSLGRRICVGRFLQRGLSVSGIHPAYSHDFLRVVLVRKFPKLESRKLGILERMKTKACNYCGKRTRHMYSISWIDSEGIYHDNFACEKHKELAYEVMKSKTWPQRRFPNEWKNLITTHHP